MFVLNFTLVDHINKNMHPLCASKVTGEKFWGTRTFCTSCIILHTYTCYGCLYRLILGGFVRNWFSLGITHLKRQHHSLYVNTINFTIIFNSFFDYCDMQRKLGLFYEYFYLTYTVTQVGNSSSG